MNHLNERYPREPGYRTRCLETLLVQLEQDSRELNRRWKAFEREPMNESRIEEVVKILGWLKQGVRGFRELMRGRLEGVSCTEVMDIENDIHAKEQKMRGLLFAVAIEIENSHLR
jgi:hypothetical protein